MLLVEISRNFVTCFSGPALLPWLAIPAKEKQVLCYLQWGLPGSGQAAFWETLRPEFPCGSEG